MPVHDWTLVDDGIFHAFHTMWIGQINTALNDGLLPDGYYALPEQHTGAGIADVLTLHVQPSEPPPQPVTGDGGIAVVEAAPRVRVRQTIEQTLLARQRSIAIRHVSGHRLVALLEIVSPANKDRAAHVAAFAAKAVDALETGVHLLFIDLFPPGANDPYGMHGVIRQRLEQSDRMYDLPSGEPLTLAAYSAGPKVEAYLEHVAVGATLPDMPLFLNPQRYVNAPLEPTYLAAYRGMPKVWREVLERRTPTAS